jgi:hypothetical protein
MNEREKFEAGFEAGERGPGRGASADAALVGNTLALPLAPASVPSCMARLLRLSRKIGVAVLGGALLLVGVALIFLPGPAVVVIPLGLAVLGTEFPWAQRLQRYVKLRAASALALAKRAVPGR